jgi:hypothetical protein
LLDQTQDRVRKNDEIKSHMATQASVRLLRFWETDIEYDGFTQLLEEML